MRKIAALCAASLLAGGGSEAATLQTTNSSEKALPKELIANTSNFTLLSAPHKFYRISELPKSVKIPVVTNSTTPLHPVWMRKPQVTAAGVEASHGRFHVALASNLNTPGSVKIQTPDGKVLVTHVLGLSYYDASSDKSVVIAELKNSLLQKASASLMIYRDAFKGVKADVRYRYERNSFEQDVILRENPPSPSVYGLNPDTTRLEVMTEFVDPPPIVKQTNLLELRKITDATSATSVKVVNENALFGKAKVVQGKAFALTATNGSVFKTQKLPVAKSFETIGGRNLLIEGVDYKSAQPQLERLPAAKQPLAANATTNQTARVARATPPGPPWIASTEPLLAVQTRPETEGFVLDYVIVGESITDTVWVEDSVPDGPYQDLAGTWNWITNGPAPASGNYAHANSSTNPDQHYFQQVDDSLSVNVGDVLYCWVYLDPTNVPSEIMLQWNNGQATWDWLQVGTHPEYGIVGYDEFDEPIYDWYDVNDYEWGVRDWSADWSHRAYWGSNLISWGTDGTDSRRYVGPLPAPGIWTRLEVPAASVGLEGESLTGMAFVQHAGSVAFDRAGKLSEAADVGWVNDSVPSGASSQAYYDSWTWISNAPSPQLGSLSHRSVIGTNSPIGVGQHSFEQASSTLTVGASNALYAYVYLDYTNPPTEIMLQWCYAEEQITEVCDEYDEFEMCISSHFETNLVSNWDHRAYWGTDSFFTNYTRTYRGPLPRKGRWIRLEVPASVVDLEGKELWGMAFSANTGKVTWDNAGVTRVWSTDRDGDGRDDEWEIANGYNPWFNDPPLPPVPVGYTNYFGGGSSAGTNSAYVRPPGLTLFGPSFSGTNMLFTYADTGTNGTASRTNQAWDILWKPTLDTNVAWQVLGTIAAGLTNITIPTLTNATAFFILVSGADYDGDGLSDGVEYFIAKTDWQNADSNNNGILDGDEVALGLNPLVDDTANPAKWQRYLYNANGVLTNQLGTATGHFLPDAEGNLTDVAP